MPRGGHNAKPTAQHIADGTFQKVRHAKRLEVKPASQVPPPPADFDAEHAAKWNQVCQLLLDAEILADQDVDAIRNYVENNLTATRSYADVLANGYTIETEHGPRLNPSWRVYQEARKMEKMMYDQFGFTPRARMGLKVDKDKGKKEEDPFEALFTRKKQN